AVRTVQAKTAGAAQCKRRIATAIEEQQSLLTAFQRGLYRAGKARRDEAPARRALALQVDRLDRGLALTAKTLRQREAMIASAPRVDFGFDRRRRGRQDDRDAGEVRAHHRHVARMIVHAILLLVGSVVLLVDDDQPKIPIGEK